MRFVLGPIPSNNVYSPAKGDWTPLREPSSAKFSIQVLLISLPLVVFSIAILQQVKGNLRSNPVQLVALLSFFALMIPVHELIHGFAYPGGLRSKYLVMGAWLQRGLFYVLYDSPLPRNRVLFMLVAPFLVFTMSLVVLIWLAPDAWRMLGVLALLIHTAVCFGDFLTLTRILRQVPADSQVLNDGWFTYWKPMLNGEVSA